MLSCFKFYDYTLFQSKLNTQRNTTKNKKELRTQCRKLREKKLEIKMWTNIIIIWSENIWKMNLFKETNHSRFSIATHSSIFQNCMLACWIYLSLQKLFCVCLFGFFWVLIRMLEQYFKRKKKRRKKKGQNKFKFSNIFMFQTKIAIDNKLRVKTM